MPQEYPKMKYARGQNPVIVNSKEEEDKLDAGWWYDYPDFTNAVKPVVLLVAKPKSDTAPKPKDDKK